MRVGDQGRSRLDQLPGRADRGGEGLRLAKALGREPARGAFPPTSSVRGTAGSSGEPPHALLLERLQVDRGQALDLRADAARASSAPPPRRARRPHPGVQARRRLQLREDARRPLTSSIASSKVGTRSPANRASNHEPASSVSISASVKSFAYHRFTGWPPAPVSITARSGKRASTSVVRSSVSSCRQTRMPSWSA